METRTVWQMVWDDYQKWLYKTLRGFGPFSLDRKKNSAIGLSKVVNTILAIIGTPWIIAHWVAFFNKNVRPQRTCNKVGYWIALIIALVLDLIPLAILALFMWVRYNHPVYGIEKWFTILFVFAPLFYAGVSKLPYLFMNDPIIREEEHQNQETEIEYPTDYEDDEEQEEGFSIAFTNEFMKTLNVHPLPKPERNHCKQEYEIQFEDLVDMIKDNIIKKDGDGNAGLLS